MFDVFLVFINLFVQLIPALWISLPWVRIAVVLDVCVLNIVAVSLSIFSIKCDGNEYDAYSDCAGIQYSIKERTQDIHLIPTSMSTSTSHSPP